MLSFKQIDGHLFLCDKDISIQEITIPAIFFDRQTHEVYKIGNQPEVKRFYDLFRSRYEVDSKDVDHLVYMELPPQVDLINLLLHQAVYFDVYQKNIEEEQNVYRVISR